MTYVNMPNKPQVSSADACLAAGIDIATLKNWVSRGVILLDKNERTPGDRPTFVLQLATVYQIAIVSELVKLGISPSHAREWAWTFTEAGGKGRPPGTLFKDGLTYMGGNAELERPQIVNVTEETRAYELLALTDTGGTVILLNLGGLIQRVKRALGV